MRTPLSKLAVVHVVLLHFLVGRLLADIPLLAELLPLHPDPDRVSSAAPPASPLRPGQMASANPPVVLRTPRLLQLVLPAEILLVVIGRQRLVPVFCAQPRSGQRRTAGALR